MTREIKFRVWDTECIKMAYGAEHGIYNCFDFEDLLDDPNRFILMQFTGLTDCHGVDIFEGDILALDGGDGPTNAEVGYDDGCFIVKVPWVNRDEYVWPELKYYTDMVFVEATVVGNVHQNPELLETRNEQ